MFPETYRNFKLLKHYITYFSTIKIILTHLCDLVCLVFYPKIGTCHHYPSGLSNTVADDHVIPIDCATSYLTFAYDVVVVVASI